jgi:hypothetical protein
MGVNTFTVQEAIDEARATYLNDVAGQRYTDGRMTFLFQSSYDIILLELVKANVPFTKQVFTIPTSPGHY